MARLPTGQVPVLDTCSTRQRTGFHVVVQWSAVWRTEFDVRRKLDHDSEQAKGQAEGTSTHSACMLPTGPHSSTSQNVPSTKEPPSVLLGP